MVRGSRGQEVESSGAGRTRHGDEDANLSGDSETTTFFDREVLLFV
jgi:hypothetical protein